MFFTRFDIFWTSSGNI